MRQNAWLCCLLFFVFLAFVPSSDAGSEDMYPLNSNEPSCTCGTANRRRRIIGGKETDINEYPWMAEILVLTQQDNRSFVTKLCGGALIDAKWVVTAAHCFGDLKEPDLLVDVGDHDISKSTETKNQFIRVSKIIMHEKYNRTSVSNDIALLQLSKAAVFSQNVLPACLPPLNQKMDNLTITVTGYGATEQGGSLSNILNEVDIPVVSSTKCKDAYKKSNGIIDSSVFCAGVPDGSKDSCQGDSGSPASIMCNNVYTFCGVVSYGVGCGNPLFPGVLSSVSYFRDWIVKNAVGASLCVHNCNPSPTPDVDCGWANNARRRKRVVGGSNILPNQFPWMVSLYTLSNKVWSFTCGATLISNDWVVTSAKCVTNSSGITLDKGDIFVVLGSHNTSTTNPSREQEFRISQVIVHPNYNTPFLANDIAVLKLIAPAIFTKYVKPICLPSNNMNKDYSGVQLSLLGWGRTATGALYSDVVKQVTLTTMSNQQCSSVAGYYGVVQNSMVCTVSSPNGDVCDGDGGGPLMAKGSSGRYYLAAVQSFKYKTGCGTGYPSGNTRVPYFVTWITQTTGVSPYTSNDIIF